MGFRFLHLADLHLETHFGGSQRTRARLRAATLEAFARAVDLALERELDAVLAAGDLYDDPILSLRTEVELVRQVRRLCESGAWFLYACGNHDPGGEHFRSARLGLDAEAGRDSLAARDWRRRVHVFRGAAPEQITVTGRSGAPAGIVVGAGHASSAEAENLAARFPRVSEALPVVGLLHTQIASARAAEQHDRYAPSSADDYRRLGYAYFALGHVHLRQRALEGLPAFYAGNLQGRNMRETGEKGGLLVEAHAGGFAEPEFVRLAPVRWERLRIGDLGGVASRADLVERLAARIEGERRSPGEELALVLELVGACPLARELRCSEVEQELGEALREQTSALEVRVEAAGLRSPLDRAALLESPSVLARALELVERAVGEPELLASLAPERLAGLERLAATAPGDAAVPEEERLRYLESLIEGLDEELLERCRPEGPP